MSHTWADVICEWLPDRSCRPRSDLSVFADLSRISFALVAANKSSGALFILTGSADSAAYIG